MKKAISFLLSALTCLLVANLISAQTNTAQYVGVNKCKMCHMSKAKGEQFVVWQKSAHSKAFATLATEEAKAVGKKAGVEDPQTSAKCLKCHVTGFEAAATAKAATYSQADGIECETCHGPGSLYQPMKVMQGLAKGTQDAKAVSFNKGDKTLCVKCHNQESPTYKPFKVDEFWKQIAHPMPKAS